MGQTGFSDLYGGRRRSSGWADDAPEPEIRHSDFYHRYFQGYTEVRQKRPNGRISVTRFYTQPWIVDTAPPAVRRRTRLLCAAATWACWLLYIQSMTMDVGSNRALPVLIPGMLSAITLVLLSAAVVRYIFLGRKMTIWDHETGVKGLRAISVCAAIALALTAGVKAAWLEMFGGAPGPELLSIGIVLAAAAGAGSVFLLERRTVYTTVPNDTVLPEGEAYQIW